MQFIIAKPSKKIAKRQLDLRDRLWPNLNTKWLWHRKERNGFTSIPRCMSLICAIIDDCTQGQPAAMVYLDLWTRGFDESFVTLSKSREMAFHAGFVGQRAERTWKQRMKALGDLGFIAIQPGQSGPISYALILNPYHAIRRLHAAKDPRVTQEKFNALVERCLEIGETSLDDIDPGELLLPEPPPAEAAPAAPPPPVPAPAAIPGMSAPPTGFVATNIVHSPAAPRPMPGAIPVPPAPLAEPMFPVPAPPAPPANVTPNVPAAPPPGKLPDIT
jgi:hypothetical protein